MNALKLCLIKAATPHTAITRKRLTIICPFGHLETTSEDAERQSVCTGLDGSLHQVRKSGSDAKDECFPNSTMIPEQLGDPIWNLRIFFDIQQSTVYYAPF